MCLTDFFKKINTVMYQQRAQREQREKTEKILTFFGSLSAKITLPLSNDLTTGLQIDNSFESISYICYYYNIIDEMISLASKGWYSGITFYEFYRKGGLHNVLEFY